MSSICKFNLINLYQCDPGFRTNKRNFDFHYFLYVHRGKGFYQIDQKKYSAGRGDLFYCPPFSDNIIIADSKDPFLLSGIEFNSQDPLLKKLRQHFNLLGNDFLMKCIMEMIQENTYKKNIYQEICNNLNQILIHSLVRISTSSITTNEDMHSKLLDYIVENIHRHVTHEELSEIFSYHKNSINRILIKLTGLSLKNYQIDLRIKKASDLLTYSKKSILEISEICGYNSPVFFSKQFKFKTGVSPMKFRN